MVLTAEKSMTIPTIGDGQWHDVVFHPGWQSEGIIRQMRFDVYGGGPFFSRFV